MFVKAGVKEEGQGGLHPHTAAENSWVLIEGRSSVVLDPAAAGELQGSGLSKVPDLLFSPVSHCSFSRGQQDCQLNRQIQLNPLRRGEVSCVPINTIYIQPSEFIQTGFQVSIAALLLF